MNRLDRIIKEEIENSQDDFGFDINDNDEWRTVPNENEIEAFRDLQVGDYIYYYFYDEYFITKQKIVRIESDGSRLLFWDASGHYIPVSKRNNSVERFNTDNGCVAVSLEKLDDNKYSFPEDTHFEEAYESALQGDMNLE